MKRFLFTVFSILIISELYSFDTFLCIDGPLRIRSEPNTLSNQIGTIRLFDKVTVIEKTNRKLTIDGITDYWYKIRDNTNLEGYVFGGYGIIIKEKYEIRTIDDFIKIFPEKFFIEEVARSVYVGKTIGKSDTMPIVQLNYSVIFNEHKFYLEIYFNSTNNIDMNKLSKDLNLKIENGGSFGMGSSYSILSNNSKYSYFADEIVTNFGNKGRYFFRSWGSDYSYDIACFLFETNFNMTFNGIIISAINLWTNKNFDEIQKIDNNYIINAKNNRIKESILFQILYELVLRATIIEN